MNAREIRDWYRAEPGYWFRPKLFGWGAVPVTWQGWLVTLGMVLVAIPIAGLGATQGLAYLALLIPAIAAFVWLCWSKTDGEWRWRWGDAK